MVSPAEKHSSGWPGSRGRGVLDPVERSWLQWVRRGPGSQGDGGPGSWRRGDLDLGWWGGGPGSGERGGGLVPGKSRSLALGERGPGSGGEGPAGCTGVGRRAGYSSSSQQRPAALLGVR